MDEIRVFAPRPQKTETIVESDNHSLGDEYSPEDRMDDAPKYTKFLPPRAPPSKEVQRKLLKTDRKEGIRKIHEARQNFKYSIDFSKEKILEAVANQLDLARKKLNSDRLLRPGSKVSKKTLVMVRDVNQATISGNLQYAIQETLRTYALNPLIKSVLLGRTSDEEAGQILRDVAKTLSEDPFVAQAVSEIRTGRSASARWDVRGKRVEPSGQNPELYSVFSFLSRSYREMKKDAEIRKTYKGLF